MTITASQTNAVESPKFASGKFSDDAGSPAAYSVTLGFTPRYVKMFNVTTIKAQEWLTGMGDADAFQVVNHDTAQSSFVTSGGITVSGGTVTFPAAAQNDVVYWIAYA